jgi:hypothetical protein
METLDDQGLEDCEVLADGKSLVRSDHERRRVGPIHFRIFTGIGASRKKSVRILAPGTRSPDWDRVRFPPGCRLQ